MNYIYNQRKIRVEWSIYKGSSGELEDFSRAYLKVFIIGPNSRYAVEASVSDISPNVTIDMPQGLPEGVYLLEAIWGKNWMLDDEKFNPTKRPLHSRDLSHAKTPAIFALTSDPAEENIYSSTGTAVVKVRSNVSTYGYDGLDAYQIAIMRGRFWGSEKEWMDSLGDRELINYYTKGEVDELIENVEVDLSGYYTKEQTDTKISEAAEGLRDEIEENTDAINDVSHRVSTNTQGIADNAGSIAANTEAITENTAEINQIKSGMNTMGGRVDELETEMDNFVGLNQSNYMGMFPDVNSLPAMTEKGWAWVGSDITAMAVYHWFNSTDGWTRYGTNTYDLTDYTQVAEQVATIGSKIGDLSQLETTDKSDLVSAINEIKEATEDLSGDAADINYTDNQGLGVDNVQDALDVVGGTVSTIFEKTNVEESFDFGISDPDGYIIAEFKDGHIQTREFNSANVLGSDYGSTSAEFGVSDEKGNVILEVKEGHIKTKNFDSSNYDEKGSYNEIPSYFVSEIEDTESKIESIQSQGVATIVIPIVTDNHIGWTDRDKERVVETLSCIHKIDKDLGIDAVVNLGDIPAMWGRSGVSDTEIFSKLKWYIDTYKGVHPRVLIANGNHDGESSDFFNNDLWYPLAKYNRDIVVRNDNSPYFYYDFRDLKVRLIFMSIPCSTDETRMTQGITTYYPAEREVHTYWGAGQKQLEWLANDALKTGDGWKVILLSHTPLGYNYSTQSGIRDLMGRVEDQSTIEGIFNAYHSHTTYSSGNVSCDFTDYTSTKMLLAIAGHMHEDMVIEVGGRPSSFRANGLPCKVVVINCQMLNGRADKTVNQDQYDYMVYNSKTEQFTFIRFGNGSDRVINV